MLPDLRKEYGVVVAARAAGSPYTARLNPGDVIHAVNSEPITTIAALRQALEKLKPSDPTVLQIERDGHMMYVDLELE
jgi:S1-C subfamily serine protease